MNDEALAYDAGYLGSLPALLRNPSLRGPCKVWAQSKLFPSQGSTKKEASGARPYLLGQHQGRDGGILPLIP